jgi:LAO/AO transport system kinase
MKELASRIAAGEARALARGLTLVENRAEGWQELMREAAPHGGRALTVGLTGAPGSGKSTLTSQLVSVLRAEGKTVGVIAVDPSSPFSGGAILGDRIRMQDHHGDAGVFIRSMAARGTLGGLAEATRDAARLMDAGGRDVVLIETVGVGQGEVEVARVAEVTAVVLVPGMGDDIQAIKAGVMEIASVFVINKADHAGADELERDLRAEQDRPIVRTVATEGKGIAELLAALRASRTRGRAIFHY